MQIKYSQLALQIGGMAVVFTLVLFLSAGTLTWVAGWVFLLLFFGFVIALSLWLVQYNPGLLDERMNGIGKADQKTWDKVFFALANVLFMLWLIVMPLDAVRFHWSYMPLILQIIGALLLLSSFGMFFLTFRENSYLSPAVRIQTERGQTVISTGPYSYVRHPMYAAFLLFAIGTTLLLGSWYGLLFGMFIVIALSRRTLMEEQTLQQELDGYTAYMHKVKYRFIPYIW